MSLPSQVPYSALTNQPLDIFYTVDTLEVRMWNMLLNRFETVNVSWRDNTPFRAALVLHSISARSDLAHVRLQTSDEKVSYRIRPEMFVKMLPRVNIVAGVIVEMWMFERRGNNVYIIPEFLKGDIDP